MARGKLLMATIAISLAGCSTHYSTANHYNSPKNLVDVAYNLGKTSYYSVPKKDRERHERCLHFSVDTLQVGEECKWHSPDSSAKGSILVASIKPNGCHVLFNTITYRSESKTWQETACMENNKWKFYRR